MLTTNRVTRANIDDAITLTDALLLECGDELLSDVEQGILRGTWEKASFSSIAKDIGWSDVDKLRTQIGRNLWFRLAPAFNVDDVRKNNYRALVEKHFSLQASSLIPVNFHRSDDTLVIAGGELPCIDHFVGRIPEIAMLSAAIQENKCVSLIGPPGIGKSALVSKVTQLCVENPTTFGFVKGVWKSISYAPSVDDLVKDLLFNLGTRITEPLDLHALISLLLEHLNTQKCLVIIDSVEAITQGFSLLNPMGGLGEYRSLFCRLIEEQHQSCIVLASQEPIGEIELLRNKGYSACSYKIEGLGKDAHKILKHLKLTHKEVWGNLIEQYSGNPLALILVAEDIRKFFGGDVKEFLQRNTTCVADEFILPLSDQLNRRTDLEKQILVCFSEIESCTFEKLKSHFPSLSITDLMQAVDRLEARSLLLQTKEKPLTYAITSIVSKFIKKNRDVVDEPNHTSLTA